MGVSASSLHWQPATRFGKTALTVNWEVELYRFRL